jgi:hypothetical protein
MRALLLLLLLDRVYCEPIYLPYSQTEDVDFTLDSPDHMGCYRYSSLYSTLYVDCCRYSSLDSPGP